MSVAPHCDELRHAALAALRLPLPDDKVQAVHTLWARRHEIALNTTALLADPGDLPGRPTLPRLVPPKQVPSRSVHTAPGRAGLLHAIAHIEFNAINLALDAVWRFPGLPADYYLDWLQVAHEEAKHYALLAAHLQTLGHAYGDFDAHDGLWVMTLKTRDDFIARMALVPRTLEARGLDATPPIQAKLAQVGDHAAVAILDIILREEVGHVAIGNRWYRHACAQAGLDAESHYRALVAQYAAPRLRPPFNVAARRQAGFSEAEMDYLLGTGMPD